MASPSEKLAVSLEALRVLQAGGRQVFKSDEFTRVHRERLVRNGFLQPIIKGWLMSSRPGEDPGDTTFWHASFWDFCAQYCSNRFGNMWHLSPELTLLVHAEATAIPRQLVIYTPRGTNNTIELPFNTTLYDLMTRPMPPAGDITLCDGLRLFTPAAALVKVSESFFARHPVEAEVSLGIIPDASDVLRPLLAGGHSAIAGRLAGAFRRAGRGEVADEILETMKATGYDVREYDPFAPEHTAGAVGSKAAPIARRIQGMWAMMRDSAINAFPAPPGIPNQAEEYLSFVDDIYLSDAYHSLSIEGYSVTPELVERVRSGDWSPEHRKQDEDDRDALAARGYWQAFQSVKTSVASVLDGAPPGDLVRVAHRAWYRELFQPFVTAGVLEPPALAGYRNVPVYLKGSRHVPPRSEILRDAMAALFDLLQSEPHPAARAVLGHWLLGYIHPYPDGNGRIARFLMNAMLASGGYPWTVIRVEDRDGYLSSLEAASVETHIELFAQFLSERVEWSMAQM